MNLPYDDGSLDACRAQTLSQHLTDPHQAAREMTRVTRPGGRAATPESGTGTTPVHHPPAPGHPQGLLAGAAGGALPGRAGPPAAGAVRARGPDRPAGHPGDGPGRPADHPDALSRHAGRLGDKNAPTPAAGAPVVVPA